MKVIEKIYFMMSKLCTVKGALALVLRIGRFAGVAPLRFIRLRDGYQISVSNYYTIYSYILITCLNISVMVGLIVDYEKRAIKTKALSNFVLFIPDIVTAMLSTGLGIYNGVKRTRNLIIYIDIFNQVRERICQKTHYKKINRRNTKRCAMLILYLVSVLIFILTQIYINMINYPTETFIVIAYGIFYAEYLIIIIMQMQIVFSLLEAHAILELMSEKMYYLLASLDENEDTSILENSNFGELPLAYITVCDVVSKMNDADSGVTVIMFANFISSVVTTGYYGDLLFSVLPVNFTLIQLSWCMLYALKILVFIETFHMFNCQVVKINVITSKLIPKVADIGKHVPREIDMMFKQLSLNEPAYIPMGLLTLNRTLIIAIFSAVTTYLIFMIQFKRPGT